MLLIMVLSLFIPLVKAEDLKLAENAKSAILIEASTGEVLFEKNADEKLVPASMTKMMSMLLILEAIENGVLKWDQVITVSENASSMGGSQILLETGEKMTVKDLFKGVAIASGNDAVVALAEASYGSERVFVSHMNKRAKELGLKNTNFKNPHGLDTADHYSSARDMSLIAKALSKHEKVFEFTSVYEDYLRQNTDITVKPEDSDKIKEEKEKKKKFIKEESIFGREITSTARIAKMNMILFGDGRTNIEQMDCLSQVVNEKYKIAISNIPYSQEVEYGSLYDYNSKNGDSVFMQHIWKSIKKGGRIAVVVPDTFLYGTNDVKNIREKIIKESSRLVIISLPRGVFNPYTPTKTSIIYEIISKRHSFT